MKNTLRFLAYTLIIVSVYSCSSDDDGTVAPEPTTFVEVGEISLGGEGAAEITAHDPATQQLFVVNNSQSAAVDVIDISDITNPSMVTSIDMSTYGGGVNSVAVSNGLLAVANENDNKQAAGSITIFNTSDLSLVNNVTVGALPDMVTFTPDGNYILSANEGEPSDDYTVDPNGSISIITVGSYQVNTIDFTSFNSQQSSLEANGFRVFGPGADLAADVEPEYIAISDDSRTAYVTLQENNGMAIVDISSQTITSIVPLGLKDWNVNGLEIDVSDKDGGVGESKGLWPILGMYQPDAIAFFSINNTAYVITANEGDAREYDAYEEELRGDDLDLDPTVFSDAAILQQDENLGRIKVTSTNGDTDGDNDNDQIWTFGARSFSIWSGSDGSLLFDSGADTENRAIEGNVYPDDRSDDKGTEPEGVTVGVVGSKTYAFVGLERADAVLVYDISNPLAPIFVQLLNTGDAPEGVLFISASNSPSESNLLVVSSEDDGVVKIFEFQ